MQLLGLKVYIQVSIPALRCLEEVVSFVACTR
jgi:hypothetical protein